MTDTCSTCLYWREGRCAAKAPEPINVDANSSTEYKAVWPLTDADDWCACFVKKP